MSKLGQVVNNCCPGFPPVVLDATGYVILQYLPLCCSSAAKPGCPFTKVAGIQVEKVLPYNTKMGKNRKQAGEDGEFGPEEVWADTKHHFKIMKQKKTQLISENWDAAMDFAQKVTDIYLRTLTPARAGVGSRGAVGCSPWGSGNEFLSCGVFDISR